MKKIITTMILSAAITGCSSSEGSRSVTTLTRHPINELERSTVPGTVNDVWTEPMVDTVRVPGAIDRKKVYYRMGHTEVVEIRDGRFQMVEYPEDRSGAASQGH